MPLPLAEPPVADLPAAARPTRPCLTPRVRSALRGSVRWNYPESGRSIPVLAPSSSWDPPPLEPIDIAAAKTAIVALERYLTPPDPEWLAIRIAALLAHAWVPELEESAMAMLVDDWSEALARFPGWAVAQAARELIGSGPRLTIAAMVEACIRLIADTKAELAGLRRLVDPAEQERARARAKQREEEERREAERVAFVTANPDWSPLKDALRRVVESQQDGESDGQGSA
jgi:hypothetical protein